MTSFEASNSVFNLTNENNSFSITTPGHWSSRGGAETINKLQKLLKLRSENDIKVHVKEVERRGKKIKKDTRNMNYLTLILKKRIEELKNVEYIDLEDMVFRMELTYSEIEKILDVKYIATSIIGYTLPVGIYEISDNNSMIKSLLPNNVKVNITIDDIRLKSNLTTNKTKKFTKKIFFLCKTRFRRKPFRSTK